MKRAELSCPRHFPLQLFVIYSGDIYNEGEPVIEELEAFFVDVEIVE